MKQIIILLLVIAVLVAPRSLAQQTTAPPPTPDQQDERVVVSSNEVALDAVIKDKKGRPVTDLTENDFEVYEDGVRQQLKSMRLVKREAGTNVAAATGAEAGAAATTTQTARVPAANNSVAGVTATALVFDRLSPEARSFARDAALSYANQTPDANNFVGVFNIDLALRLVQPYTTDMRLVMQAINNTGSKTSPSHSSNVDQVQNSVARQESLRSTIAAAGTVGEGGSGAAQVAVARAATADLIFAQMTQRSLEVFEMLQRDQQGYATTNSLLAVVNSMQRLPGRKAVIFFSEGLAIPPGVQTHFRSVINTANRSGVSIYAVDAAGLRVISGNDVTRREISRLANQGINRAGEEPTGRPLTMDLERNEDLLRANPESGLGQLASETGGLLISDTNNLKDRLRQVDEDLHTYYLLTYVPQNQDYNGRFRQISLKLKRSGLDVQSRKGYFAINSSFASPVLAYEAPALAALNNSSRAGSLPIASAALSFPQTNRLGLVPVLVEASSRAVTFSSSADNKLYTTDFTILALIKDEQRQVVRKLSNQYQLSGPLNTLEAAKRSDILFYREVELPPGRYTVETVIYDAPSGKTGVRTANVEVPASDSSALRLSSLVIIDRIEQLKAADKNPASPFQVGEVLIYPNLGEPLRKASSKKMAFFFTVYMPPAEKAAPKMTLEILQGARAIANIQSDLPAPDAQGRVQHASALPLDSFKPGTYELKITIKGAQEAVVSRAAQFTVEP